MFDLDKAEDAIKTELIGHLISLTIYLTNTSMNI